MAFGEGHGNMISLVHKNMVILIIFTGGVCACIVGQPWLSVEIMSGETD